MQKKHIYNLHRDKKDPRDFKLRQMLPPVQLPPAVDLRTPLSIPVYDQGQIGSCTANAGSYALEYDTIVQKEVDFMPARLFLYYQERLDDGDVEQDGGSSLRECVTAIHNYGVCPETMWAYTNDNLLVKPTADCYTEALKHVGVTYLSLNNVQSELEGCLAQGFPIIFGTDIYESFESDAVAKTGLVPMPLPTEQLLGGHALSCVGYDSIKQLYTVRNSWGINWGDQGFCYIPYDYFTQYASDFWTLRSIS